MKEVKCLWGVDPPNVEWLAGCSDHPMRSVDCGQVPQPSRLSICQVHAVHSSHLASNTFCTHNRDLPKKKSHKLLLWGSCHHCGSFLKSFFISLLLNIASFSSTFSPTSFNHLLSNDSYHWAKHWFTSRIWLEYQWRSCIFSWINLRGYVAQWKKKKNWTHHTKTQRYQMKTFDNNPHKQCINLFYPAFGLSRKRKC